MRLQNQPRLLHVLLPVISMNAFNSKQAVLDQKYNAIIIFIANLFVPKHLHKQSMFTTTPYKLYLCMHS